MLYVEGCACKKAFRISNRSSFSSCCCSKSIGCSLSSRSNLFEAVMAARAALASSLSRLSSRSPASNLTTRRGFAAGGDHHGPPRINIWEDPMSPSKWKEEHFVLASLSGWGLLIYGGLKAFGGKKEKKEEVVVAAAH